MSLTTVEVRRTVAGTAGASGLAGAPGLAVRAAFGSAVRAYVLTRRPFDPRSSGSGEEGCFSGGGRLVDVHTRAGLGGASPTGWPEHADVVCQGRPEPIDVAARSVGRILDRLPGCLVAGVRADGGRLVVGTRDGSRFVAAPIGERRRPLTGWECSGLASFLHAVLVSGQGWAEVGPIGLTSRSASGDFAAEERAETRVGLSGPAGTRMIGSFIA